MPKVAAPAAEMHRPALRELVKEKIRELEFKVAIEAFRIRCAFSLKRRSCTESQSKSRS